MQTMDEKQVAKAAYNLMLSMTMLEAAAMDMLDTVATERQSLRAFFPALVAETENDVWQFGEVIRAKTAADSQRREVDSTPHGAC